MLVKDPSFFSPRFSRVQDVLIHPNVIFFRPKTIFRKEYIHGCPWSPVKIGSKWVFTNPSNWIGYVPISRLQTQLTNDRYN